jgi:carbamate kinase
MKKRKADRVVVALGGNTITSPEGAGTVEEDLDNLRHSLPALSVLLDRGYEVVLTHGNGPQIGNMMLRTELGRGQAPDLPLWLQVADVQGGLGYLMQSVLGAELQRRQSDSVACTLITTVEVDAEDPAFNRPTKFVGPVLAPDVAERRRGEGWGVARDSGRGWRRVVPSPQPIRIVESQVIRALLDTGALVICCGGGGVPVRRRENGEYEGVDGVIDKDLASSVLGREIGASTLIMLTGVERVQTAFGSPEAKGLATLTVARARDLLASGEFPPGSMGPKIEAACRFIEEGGQAALIGSLGQLQRALDGHSGTWIVSTP